MILKALSDEKKLQFAVDLAESPDVSSLAPEKLEELWRGNLEFSELRYREIGDTGIGGYVVRRPHERPIPDPRWRSRERERETLILFEKQKFSRAILAGHCANEAWEVSPLETFRITLRFEPNVGLHEKLAGNQIDVFRIDLGRLMNSKVAQRIRKCPECGVIFIRIRRQIYCSDKCTDKATWRNYPEKKKIRARKRQAEMLGYRFGARKKVSEAKGESSGRIGKATKKGR